MRMLIADFQLPDGTGLRVQAQFEVPVQVRGVLRVVVFLSFPAFLFLLVSTHVSVPVFFLFFSVQSFLLCFSSRKN